MKQFTFDDVLIKPKFSTITSRKDVDISTTLAGERMNLPIFSANMATITGPEMCNVLIKNGASPVMHRFQDLSHLDDHFKLCGGLDTWWSFGVNDFARVEMLYKLGARKFCLDVAHGAQIQVALDTKLVMEELPDVKLIVGNFATAESIAQFLDHCPRMPIFKVGIGPGSMCTTRIKTGCGVPQLSAILDCAKYSNLEIIADGGMRTPGDIAKALGAGAKAVMIGSMFAGTNEAPGEIVDGKKLFHGSAFKEAPDKNHRTSEGEKTLVPVKGSVEVILQDIEGGLRSSFTYVGARNLTEFQEKCEFIEISANTKFENGAHGK